MFMSYTYLNWVIDQSVRYNCFHNDKESIIQYLFVIIIPSICLINAGAKLLYKMDVVEGKQ